MSLMIVALLSSVQATADSQGSATAVAPAPAPKEKKICRLDESSGTRMAKRLCLTAEQWANRNQNMMDTSRAGLSGKAQDH